MVILGKKSKRIHEEKLTNEIFYGIFQNSTTPVDSFPNIVYVYMYILCVYTGTCAHSR